MVKENSRGGTEELREGCNVKEMEEEEVVEGSVGEVGDEELVEGFRGEEEEGGERTGVKVLDCHGITGVNRSAVDEEEIAAIRNKSKGVFDEDDARKIEEARRKNRDQLGGNKTPKSPKFSTPERKKLVDKYRALTGNFGKEKFGQHTKREKRIILSVKRFCENEKQKYREVISVVDSYTKDKIDSVAIVPFTQVSERVELMTGISISIIPADFFT